MSKDSYYFKHDSNARHDPKIQALIKKYKIEGYGRFWIIIEMLRESTHYKLEDKHYVWLSLAEQMLCSVEEVKKFVADCVKEFELLTKEDTFFYSPALLARMIKLDDIRAKRSKAGAWERD